ncbi:unnamed protein product [Owenia fusiformis]|uniref:Uncharacterized protein n=1 Tax=Owenia fusiformis TaxID=6347 RepID=A0A8J1XWY1_OWEFU|nr:unnamed protein product [Owenia fusiformis]
MARLADYFVVVGYDHEKSSNGQSCGRTIQRFPEKDWDDCPYTQGIELFCQPTGWDLSSKRQEPTFFVSVLTDIDADRHYLSCLTFHEGVPLTAVPKPDESDEVPENNHNNHIVQPSMMFAPKSLVLISSHDSFETLRNCLGLIYTVYIENIPNVQIETLIGNILSSVQVPPPGGPQVRFSIGAGDRQALQPPLSHTIPTTNETVATLFQQLSINTIIQLFCAALSDHKILFLSNSYNRLTSACQALTALLYPFKYTYVYIPVLPAHLIEVLNTPTPFIAGVHGSLKLEVQDLLDVIICDLDGGSVMIPECVQLSIIPEPAHTRVTDALKKLLHPDLSWADKAFPPSPSSMKTTARDMLDKEIRAVFLRLFAEILIGYRSCLTLIRIHPEPFITFHKANFLGHRGLVEDDFMTKMLDSMCFSAFVSERGPPYRICDIYDEVFASMQTVINEERLSNEAMMNHIKQIAQQLYINENPNPQPYVQKIPKATEGSHNRIHIPSFPAIDWVHVQEIIDEGVTKSNIKARMTKTRPQQPRIVPMGASVSQSSDKSIVSSNARRLEVLRNCVAFIFENKITDARKIFPAVLRAMKSKMARLALTHELAYHVQTNKAQLEHQQFDLVVRLMNCALQNDSSNDENGVAAAILPLATSFCRKLSTGIIQFAYTCVQEHAVWNNTQFWEATFYQDCERQIRQLYLPDYQDQLGVLTHIATRSPRSQSRDSRRSWSVGPGSSGQPESPKRLQYRPREIGALEIAAEQLRIWPTLSKEQQQEMINNEESTVYSQAIHYANRMVYLRVPLDASRSLSSSKYDTEDNSNSNVNSSVAESDSLNETESGFDEGDVPEVGTNVVKFVTRFVDKVCSESGVTEEHIKSLHQMIPGVVAMHIETLEAVHKESKRLPPIQKPKILTPTLLPGEEIVMEGLRVYLIADGREEGLGTVLGGPALLPAEGAVFLTTYRVIFKGTPVDPLACEQIVCRMFPISTLTKEKKINVQYLQHIEQWLQEGVQLRSNTFQLMKVVFDEEVGTENADTFRKLLHRMRNPPSVWSTFAFTGCAVTQPTQMHAHKDKNSSLKAFAKRTLHKTAKTVGLKGKDPNRKQKYIHPSPTIPRKTYSPKGSPTSSRPSSVYDDNLSIIEEGEVPAFMTMDPKVLEKLFEKPGYKDFQRMGLGELPSFANTKSRTDPYRISTVNCGFSVCRSYPALIVVPQSVSDDSIRKFSRSHRQYRFPVITWRHDKTKAVLLRASGFHTKGVMSMLKSHSHHHQPTPSASLSELSTSVEQEKYFHAVVSSTPIGQLSHSQISDSLTSIDSLILTAGTSDTLTIPETPGGTRKNYLARAVSSLRSSGGRVKSLGRLGSVKSDKRMSSASLQAPARANGNVEPSIGDVGIQGLHRAALYVLGEKAQVKAVKVEQFPKCDFIPVEFTEVRHVKASFKKLMRACVPSATSADPEMSFYKAVQDSDWLKQLQNILQLAGVVVDLMDVQGSSVMLCLEDGWDITTQVSAVAQVLLDPYYRTIEGFRALIEKEWLSFGHRFTHRSNQTAANQASGFAPIFLQFLDVVHQIHLQFPLSFEFNQYFLKFLAFHYVSNRFRTFMLDNEYERMMAGWLLEEKHIPTKDDENLGNGSGFVNRPQSIGQSIWDYIEKFHRRSPIFFNFEYTELENHVVLRPFSNISNLRIWDYFVSESLDHGPSYDIEIVAKEMKQVEEDDLVDGTGSLRKIANFCYDNQHLKMPEGCSYLLSEIHRLEKELDRSPQKWHPLWDKLDHPDHEQLTRQVSLNTQLAQSHGRSIHKRSTIEILMRAKMSGETAKMFSQPHKFEKHNYTMTTLIYCDYCSQVLFWGLIKTGMRCTDCNYNCHEKCMPYVPKNCASYKRNSEASTSQQSLAKAPSETNVGTLDTLRASDQNYDQFQFVSSVQEHRTHEGYLFKRGALFGGWKQRWFVLDSMKHQLRQYETSEDSNCKGFIDFSDVTSVTALKKVEGAPKRSDENAFFEMRTNKRIYHFLAPDSQAAQDWIDKIQSCITG